MAQKIMRAIVFLILSALCANAATVVSGGYQRNIITTNATPLLSFTILPGGDTSGIPNARVLTLNPNQFLLTTNGSNVILNLKAVAQSTNFGTWDTLTMSNQQIALEDHGSDLWVAVGYSRLIISPIDQPTLIIDSAAVFPDGNNTFDLGANSNQWKVLYVIDARFSGDLYAKTLRATNALTMNNLTASRVAYVNGSSQLTNMPAGTAGQVLTSDGTSGASWSNEVRQVVIPLQVQSAWRPSTNMPLIEAGFQQWELLFPHTNSAGAAVDLQARWQFNCPTNMVTNTLSLGIYSMLIATNGPNSSNAIWKATVLRHNTADGTATNDARVGPFDAGTSQFTTTWAADYQGTNKVQFTSITISNCTMAAGESGILKLEKMNSVDATTKLSLVDLKLRCDTR